MNIRPIKTEEAMDFFQMLCTLDSETNYMMYEPGERQQNTVDLSRLKTNIENAVSDGDLLLVAENEERQIVDYLWAERGMLNRIHHTAYIVTGILRSYRNQGVGTKFFAILDEWARENGILRLELTVECPNTAAKHLYEKNGFVVEGVRRKSMYVSGEYVDEFYMAKILG